MTRPMRLILGLFVMLSACHAQQKAGHGEVSGQILPGSVSDAMLPYDAVKSKAPLAPREATDEAGDAGDADSADSADTAASSASAPEIAASPGPAVPAAGQNL